jgi:hypothetical protein
MRSDQGSGDRNQSIEKLKEKWTESADGLSLAIRQEEMRIRREELEKYAGTHSQHSAPLKPAQKRGGKNA